MPGFHALLAAIAAAVAQVLFRVTTGIDDPFLGMPITDVALPGLAAVVVYFISERRRTRRLRK